MKQDIVIFAGRLAAMVKAGLPVVRCLDTLGKQTENSSLRKVLREIVLDIEGGEKLSVAFARHPVVFSPFFVNLIRAGETGGILDEALERIAEYLEKERTLARNVKRAFAYPTIVLAAAVVVVTFLMVFVVPVFAETYRRSGVALPIPTVMLINISRFARGFWWLIALAAAAAFFALKYYYATSGGKMAIDRIKLGLPVFGELAKKVVVSRFVRTFGSLYASGVTILDALDTTRGITDNAVFAGVITTLEEGVKQGKKVAEILARESIFPPMVVQMIASGEEAGVMDDMLEKCADFLDEDIDYAVSNLVARLEPALTITLAAVVGFIALAIYLPVFDIMSSFGK